MMPRRGLVLCLLAGLLLTLNGCEDAATVALKAWMEQTRHQTQPPPPKLALPLSLQSFRYEAAQRADPFDSKNIAAGFAASHSASAGLQPDLQRGREPLEAFPLDSLKMVGILRRPGLAIGLIEADKTIYQAKLGNYLGQDLGRVVAISERAIEIDEMVQDPGGNWNHRRVQLNLQEK